MKPITHAATGFGGTTGEYVYWWVDVDADAHSYAIATSTTASGKTVRVSTDNFVTATPATLDIRWDTDRDDIAVINVDNTITFKASYTDNSTPQYDADGKLSLLEANGTFVRKIGDADVGIKGTSVYEVEFTFPDGKTSGKIEVGCTDFDVSTTTYTPLYTSAALDPWAESVVGAAFLFKNAEDKELFGIPYFSASKSNVCVYTYEKSGSTYEWKDRALYSINGVPAIYCGVGTTMPTDKTSADYVKNVYVLEFDKGSVSYQPVYKFQNTKSGISVQAPMNDDFRSALYEAGYISDISTFKSEEINHFTLSYDPAAIKACGATTYSYNTSTKPLTIDFTNKKGVYSAAVVKYAPTFYDNNSYIIAFAGDHSVETLTQWVKSYDQKQVATHELHGYAIVKCKGNDYSSGYASLQDLTKAGYTDYPNTIVDSNVGSVLVLPKAATHTYEMDGALPKVYSYKANCVHGGFDYNVCTVNDAGWTVNSSQKSATYTLYLDSKKTQSATFKATIGDKNARTGEYAVTIYDELDDKIADTTATETTTTSTGSSYIINWHPVLVDGTLTAIGSHNLFIRNINAGKWYEANGTTELATPTNIKITDDVVFKISAACTLCTKPVDYTYHKRDAVTSGDNKDPLDEGSTDTCTVVGKTSDSVTKYAAISVAPEAGKDCLTQDTLTWTVDGLTDSNGRAAKFAATSGAYYGSHSYVNTVNWAEDGSATVVQTCSKNCGDHVDVDGNKHQQTKKATVQTVENPDGSTTYTATLEGYTSLKNDTLTVFDLSKATVEVNGGEDLDLGTLASKNVSQLITDKLITVKIGDVAISSNNYVLSVKNGTSNNLFVGYNEIVVSPSETATSFVRSASVIVNCYEQGKLGLTNLKVDGISPDDTRDYSNTFDYDGSAHTVTASAMNGTTHAAVDANIKYAVIYQAIDKDKTVDDVWRYADTDAKVATKYIKEAGKEKKVIDESKLEFTSDSVSVTDAGKYTFYAQIEAEGFTTAVTSALPTVTIYMYDTDDAVISTKTRTWTYGDKGFKATTGSDAMDELIGLTTEDISTYGPGNYALDKLAKFDNRNYDATYEKFTEGTYAGDIVSIVIGKRNATVELKDATIEYTGKEYTPEANITGVVNDDDLGVEINVEGGRKIVEPGTYKVTATANHANYDITITPATIVVAPSQADAVAAKNVTDKIDALGSNPTEAQVKEARAAYDKLTDTQKAVVGADELAKLVNAETEVAKKKGNVDALVAQANSAADAAAKNPTTATVEAAEKAIAAAKASGATDAQLKSASDKTATAKAANITNLVAAANKAAETAAKNPTSENIAAANAAIKAAQTAGATSAQVKAAQDNVNKAVQESTEKKNATIKVSATKVKKGKKTTVKITSDAGTKITVTGTNKKAKNKKSVKIKSGTTAKLTFQKKAKKGTYKFKVTTAENAKFKATSKTIKIKVK